MEHQNVKRQEVLVVQYLKPFCVFFFKIISIDSIQVVNFQVFNKVTQWFLKKVCSAIVVTLLKNKWDWIILLMTLLSNSSGATHGELYFWGILSIKNALSFKKLYLIFLFENFTFYLNNPDGSLRYKLFILKYPFEPMYQVFLFKNLSTLLYDLNLWVYI